MRIIYQKSANASRFLSPFEQDKAKKEKPDGSVHRRTRARGFLFNAVLRKGYPTTPHASEEKSFRCKQDKAKKKNPTGAYIDVRDQGVFFSTQYCEVYKAFFSTFQRRRRVPLPPIHT